MSAFHYFRDVADIRWRLADTVLYIGNTLWKVRDVNGAGDIYLVDVANKYKPQWVSINRLPSSALWRAPRGYAFLDRHTYWLARGPSRDRQQGLTNNSIWYRDADFGEVGNSMFSIYSYQILGLLYQRDKLQKYSAKSLISRDVLTKEGVVYYKGVPVGEASGRKAKLSTDSPQLKVALEKVGLNVKS